MEPAVIGAGKHCHLGLAVELAPARCCAVAIGLVGDMPRILLVEDDVDVRHIIQHVLIDDGHVVDISGTTAGGIELLRDKRYDLVVADAKLPDGFGIEVADRAAEQGVGSFIITGYAFSLPAAAFRSYDVLLKPLRPAEISAAVERALLA